MRLMDQNQDVLEFSRPFRIYYHDRRPHPSGRVHFKNIETSQIPLRQTQIGVRQDLPWIERNLPQNNVLPRDLVADDSDFADPYRRTLLDLVVQIHFAGSGGKGLVADDDRSARVAVFG